ncbi:septation protein IspZ [Ferrovum sp. PN-J185]|uniref:septation protein IspZ n=1 Tax=Ferrovum sp. PN-J185 TaxID=1356306 RepID=UPI0007960833|nr:septation protein IspZ [Ferrovum sp. PN-J185]KXW56542.1 intracellular septation protein A [Ferrovum sp. PN-J185]
MSLTSLVIVLLSLIVAVLWRPRHRIDGSAWGLLFVFICFGLVTLWFVFHQDLATRSITFNHFKPSLFYWTLAVVLVVFPRVGWGYPAKWIIGPYFPMANSEWFYLNQVLILLYVFLGILNAYMFLKFNDSVWIDFKESCYMNLLVLILVRINFIWLHIFKNIFDLIKQLFQKNTP